MLLTRSGGESASDFVKSLQDQGAKVETPACDVSDRGALELVLKETNLPPIKGCVNAAVIIKVNIPQKPNAVILTLTFIGYPL